MNHKKVAFQSLDTFPTTIYGMIFVYFQVDQTRLVERWEYKAVAELEVYFFTRATVVRDWTRFDIPHFRRSTLSYHGWLHQTYACVSVSNNQYSGNQLKYFDMPLFCMRTWPCKLYLPHKPLVVYLLLTILILIGPSGKHCLIVFNSCQLDKTIKHKFPGLVYYNAWSPWWFSRSRPKPIM